MNQYTSLDPETLIDGTDLTIRDFWQWGFSNLLTNSLRGIFAEFLVGAAIGALDGNRIEWDAFDLKLGETRIEVKSAAYLQVWHTGTHSKIIFNIGAKKEYDYSTNSYNSEASRNADIYVFCLLSEKDAKKVNPLDTSQWEFYVVPTVALNDRCPVQKTLSLSTLQKFAEPVSYHDMREAVSRYL